MTEDPGAARRRRRRRATAAQGPPARTAEPAPAPVDDLPAPAPQPDKPRSEAPKRRRPPAPRDQGERGLRDLVGAGSSQLGVSGALRGRDVNRPSEQDLAEAEREVVIVRRNWRPDDRRS